MKKKEIIDQMLKNGIESNNKFGLTTAVYPFFYPCGTRFNGACATNTLAEYVSIVVPFAPNCSDAKEKYLINTRSATRDEVNEVIAQLKYRFSEEKKKGEDANSDMLIFLRDLIEEIVVVFNKKAKIVESIELPSVKLL